MPPFDATAAERVERTTFRAVDRLGFGPVFAFALLALLGWQMKSDRDSFLASLDRNTAALERLATTIADARALCPVEGLRR